MAETPLRDHSEKCDHDADWYWEISGTQRQRVYQCNRAACPGGREVTIDRKAMQNVFIAHASDQLAPHVSMTAIDAALDSALDAALGI